MEDGEINVTRGFKVSGMPMGLWMKWEKDCIDNFGNCYWLKLWNDHEKALQYDIIVNQIMRKFEEYDQLFDELLNVKQEEKEKVKTFGRSD